MELARVVDEPQPSEHSEDTAAFRAFVTTTEPGLRRALVAAYGSESGRDAAADALAWAWQHWDKVRAMTNPAGYLWRVGQTAVRRSSQWARREQAGVVHEVVIEPLGRDIEPRLGAAMAALSAQQRAAVLLVHGYGFSLTEAGELLGCSASTIRNHVGRALTRLRTALEAGDG